MPSNNLIGERLLGVFDKRASKVAKYRNSKFTGKSIRNDLMLHKGLQEKVDDKLRKITKLLNEREKWNEIQKEKMVKRIDEKLQKASKDIDYTKKLLIDCKTWNGPVTSGEELIKAMKSRPSQEVFILRTELAYYTHTHRTDKIQRPELY